MQFSNPLFLWTLFAVVIPVIIHLFNFRKYKKIHFSNVQLLHDIIQKTKKESRLMHLIVMSLRMLAIAALTLAFAQPFIPHGREQQKSGSAAVIFVDNSFSMLADAQSSNLLQEAIDAAKNIVNAYAYTDDFVLVTQDFSPKESRLLSKDEILSLLDGVEMSRYSRNWIEIGSFCHHAAKYTKKDDITYYYISDFQKNEYNFADYTNDGNHPSVLVAMEGAQIGNIDIDSCWFTAPVFKKGQQVTVHVSVKNYSKQDLERFPMQLYINNEQKAVVAMDLKAGSAAEYQVNYTITQSGIQSGKWQIDNSPVTFDDRLFFVYEVTPATKIITINGGHSNKYLTALYGKDSLFIYSEMNGDRVDYSQLGDCKLLIVNELEKISSGMASELKKYVENGGSLMIFPSEQQEPSGWQAFFTSLSSPHYATLVKAPLKVGEINKESVYYKNALEKQQERMDMPSVLQYFELQGQNRGEVLMKLENQAPLLSVHTIGKGKLFLSAISLSDPFGDVHKHALFFIPMHNIGIMSQLDRSLYHVMGQNESQIVNGIAPNGDLPVILKSQDNGMEIIPEQHNAGANVLLFFHDQITEPGFYDLMHNGAKIGAMAANFTRKESQLEYYSHGELSNFSKNDAAPFTLMDGAAKDLTQSIVVRMHGVPIWQLFLLLALILLLAEILILRFWGIRIRAKNR